MKNTDSEPARTIEEIIADIKTTASQLNALLHEGLSTKQLIAIQYIDDNPVVINASLPYTYIQMVVGKKIASIGVPEHIGCTSEWSPELLEWVSQQQT